MISQGQVDLYRENGFLVVPDVFTPTEMQGLRNAADELIEQARYVTASDDRFELEDGHGPNDVRIRRLRRPITSDPRFFEASRSDKILDIIAQLIGPEIRISHPLGKVNMKDAGFGKPIEWHQDWVGYPHTNEDLLAIGVPLDDIELDNGPVLMLPGTHKGPIYSEHNEQGQFVAGIDPVASGLDFSKAVPLTGKAGMITIHHVRTVHGSAANTSSKPRRLLIMQYAAVDAWPLLGVPDINAFNAAILRGKPTLRPRMEKLPVLMPGLSTAHHMLYEAQSRMDHQFFEAPTHA
jgi:phytanoyl-CoA hydroxylase